MANDLLRVLVTDAQELAALGALRSLGRAGHRVTIAAPKEAGVPASRASRHVAAALCSPDPWADQPASRAWLRQQVEGGGFDAVLPISEASLVAAAAVRATSAAPVRWLMPGDAALRYSLSKYRTTQAAAAHGVPVPHTVYLAPGAGEVDAAARGYAPDALAALAYPLLIKTDNQLRPDGRYAKGRTTRVASPEEAAVVLAECSELGVGAIAQEIIPGGGAGVFLLRHGGIVHLRFAHRRLHEVPYSGGYSSLRASCHDEALLAHAERLLAAIDYDGVAMVEFRRTPQGAAYLLEINGRLWGSLALALHAGVDFPLALLTCSGGGPGRQSPQRPMPAQAPYADGLRCRNVLPGEVHHVTSVLRAARAPHPAADQAEPARPSVLRTLGEFVALSLDPRVRHDHLWWTDPGPGLWQAARFADDLLGKLRRRVGGLAGRRGDARLLQAARQRRAALGPPGVLDGRRPWPWAGEREVLFLCYGNIYRSPFAAAYFNRLVAASGRPGPLARSAGFYAVSGRPSPARARALSRGHGVDLGAHRSTVVSAAMVEAAAAIFVMDRRNLAQLAAAHPAALRKTYLLAHFAPGPAQADEIADPYEQDLAVARQIYAALVAALDGLLSP